ncbi:MAG TPA: hypothetical protein VGN52_00535 [Burkholderiales bacterium]|jgi:hypothetical protein
MLNEGSSYRGTIPLELYLELQNKFPQFDGESEQSWLNRLRGNKMLAPTMFGTAQFKDELLQAVARRTMAQAGARRVGHKHAGPSLAKLTKPGDKQAVSTIAQRYREEFMDGRQYKYAKEAYELLMEQFDATTSRDGAVFWNGINELTLAKKVNQWNSEMGSQFFGQLEATTVARYVNKQFVWENGGVFQRYFTEVSAELGHAAKGHVTAVVRCGLRNDSIFTTTELPRMLKNMEDKIVRKQAPDVTDLTIVVIQPKQATHREIMTYTNLEITQIPIVRNIAWPCTGPKDCVEEGRLNLSIRMRNYWGGRPQPKLPEAANRVMRDFQDLIKWG